MYIYAILEQMEGDIYTYKMSIAIYVIHVTGTGHNIELLAEAQSKKQYILATTR